MKCGFEDLPLNTNHICPECKRPIHAVCVGRHLEDAPLGRDIICFDCIEDEELSGPRMQYGQKSMKSKPHIIKQMTGSI
jgi:hypothetical protein